MADENVVVSDTETADTKPVVAPKKTRAPRQPKTTTAPLAKAEPVKRGKRLAKAPVETASKETDTVKKSPRAAVSKPPAVKASSMPASNNDDFSDLMKLEEENQQLRKALAEKLRIENADLKKKLGMA
jgi:putative transposase